MPQLVSVITTAYNAEDYVKDAVSSILNQTYSNLEYIIVDDGSTDGTIDRVRSFRDNRLRLVEAGRVGRFDVGQRICLLGASCFGDPGGPRPRQPAGPEHGALLVPGHPRGDNQVAGTGAEAFGG